MNSVKQPSRGFGSTPTVRPAAAEEVQAGASEGKAPADVGTPTVESHLAVQSAVEYDAYMSPSTSCKKAAARNEGETPCEASQVRGTVRERVSWEFLKAETLDGPMKTRPELLSLLRSREEWQDFRVDINARHATSVVERFVVRCRETANCPKRWETHYYRQVCGHKPKTLLLQQSCASHNHTNGSRASGKLWTPKQERLAGAADRRPSIGT